MAISPRKVSRRNGFVDGLQGKPCNTEQYKTSWPMTTEYLAGYMEGQDKRHSGIRFPQEDE